MAAKDVKFSTDARDKFLRGVDLLRPLPSRWRRSVPRATTS